MFYLCAGSWCFLQIMAGWPPPSIFRRDRLSILTLLQHIEPFALYQGEALG